MITLMEYYCDTLTAETIRRMEDHRTAHNGKELTEDDKLSCLWAASQIPELKEVRTTMSKIKVEFANEKVMQELGIKIE